MPVSGNEEPGVKPIAWHSSDSVAGIPIKKRKFLLDLPASPPSQAESLQSVENDSLKKEPSNPSQDSSIITDASVVTSSSGLSITEENAYVEEQRETQSISNVPRVKIEEPSSMISSGSLIGTERKMKRTLAEKPNGQIGSGYTELKLATKEDLALSIGDGILSKLKAEGNCKSGLSTSLGNTELSLGPKKLLGQVLAGENIPILNPMQEKMDPISLNLSLSKGKNSTQCQSDNVESNINAADLCANRSKWDLNTTMDVWEGSANDAAAGEGAIGVARLSGTYFETKPLIGLTGKVSAGVALGSQTLEGNKHKSSIAISSTLPSQQYKSDDSLKLRLSPSFLESGFSQGQSSSSAGVNIGRVFRNISMPGAGALAGKSNVAGHSIVKSEPFEESNNQDLRGTKENSKGILDCRTLKSELVEKCVPLKLMNSSTPTLVGSRPIKSELVGEGDQGKIKTIGVTSHPLDKRLNLSITETKTHPSGVPCSKASAGSWDASDHSTYLQRGVCSGEVPQETCERVGKSASEMATTIVGQEVNESNVSDGMIDTENTVNVSIDDPNELCSLNVMDKPSLDKRENVEGPVSDEEKINISADMLEEDSYSSDYASDGNHDLDAAMDRRKHGGEDDDYEDGEVREPLVPAATGGLMCEKREEKDICSGDTDDKKTEISGLTGDEITSCVEERNCETVDPGKAINDHSGEAVNEILDEKIDQGSDKDASLQESMATETLMVGPDKKQPVKTAQIKLLDQSGRKDAQSLATEQSSDQATDEIQVAPVPLNQGVEGRIKGTNLEEKIDLAVPKAETSLNGNDAAKASSGGNRSRIINLKAANASSSCKTRSISGTSFPSRSGRERFSDSVLEGDKLYHSRGREEFYNEGPHKFSRERNRDQPFRNSRGNYSRGRGRGSSRLNTICGDWNSDRDFPPEFYNDSTGFRFPRQKHGSTVADAELECDGYIIGPDDRAVGPGRGGRKPLNEEVPNFRNFSSRRRSPGGRGVTASRGVQMVRRVPRNFSPSRCIGEEGSELVGLRHNEKFMRGLPEDIVDPMFSRSQPSYETLDGHFVRGGRNFASIQGRGLPRIRSKSPIRTGAHSPGQWSSPRRRSPDAFIGHPGLTHRRSATIYRTDRMRSPDRSCFPSEIVARRHGSPPYFPHVSNDMDSGRDHVTPRTVVRRSPSGRVVPRNNQRFDILDPSERTDTDEYFGGPMRPGRFHELGGEVSGDERRRCGERRGPGRPFRVPCNDAEGDNFHFNIEDGTRPYRFLPEAESEFSARGTSREREFDRRIKNRPGHAPRRMRGIEDQEVHYRPGGQAWHDDGFDDIRLKRRRF